MRTLAGSVLVFFFLMPALAGASRIPSLSDLGADPVQTAEIVGNRQVTMLQFPQTFELDKEKRSVRFATSMAVVAAPVTTVRNVVLDFESWPTFMPQSNRAKILDKNETDFLVEHRLVFELPVRNATVDYRLKYSQQTDGSILWDLVSGDMDGNSGRWEFFPLAGNRTLLVYTAWSDLDSMSFTIRTMLGAQPDMRVALPVAIATIIVDSVKRRSEGRLPKDPSPKSVTRTKPEIPLLTHPNSQFPIATMRKLARAGTVMVIHPSQWIQTPQEPIELIFVSAASHVQAPLEKSRHYSQQFSRYGEFFDQVGHAKVRTTPEGQMVDWRIKLGFGFVSIGIDYTLLYTQDTDPNVVWFRTHKGDIEYIFGAWQWIPLNPKESLAIYTTVSEFGANAPSVLKLANILPNRKITVGVSTAGIIAEKIAPWLVAQEPLPAPQAVTAPAGN